MNTTVITRPCPVCGEAGSVTVDRIQYDAWRNGALIQVAMPNLPPAEREQLISGTHPACWEKLFVGDGEDTEE